MKLKGTNHYFWNLIKFHDYPWNCNVIGNGNLTVLSKVIRSISNKLHLVYGVLFVVIEPIVTFTGHIYTNKHENHRQTS